MDQSRKTLVLISAAIIIATLFLARSIHRGQQTRIRSLKANVSREQTKNRILEEIGKIKGELDGYQPYIPLERDVEWLRKRVAELADESQVKLLSISPQSPEDKGIYVQLSVGMVVECGYHQLGEFMDKLENSERFMKLDSIAYTKKGDILTEITKGEARGSANLVVSTFYLKE